MAVTPNSIVTAQGLKSSNAVITAAKTTYADNANAVLLMTAGANGAVVYGLTCIQRGVLAAATKVMLFRCTDGTGTVLHYVRSVLLAAYGTDAATTIPTPSDFGYSETAPLRLAANDRLYVGGYAAAANGIEVDVQYEDL